MELKPPHRAVSAGGSVSKPLPPLFWTIYTCPIFYITLFLLYHFYNPSNELLLYTVECGPAKYFGTPPFFDHKSATTRPPEHKLV